MLKRQGKVPLTMLERLKRQRSQLLCKIIDGTIRLVAQFDRKQYNNTTGIIYIFRRCMHE